jgi:hypothetical protein
VLPPSIDTSPVTIPSGNINNNDNNINNNITNTPTSPPALTKRTSSSWPTHNGR